MKLTTTDIADLDRLEKVVEKGKQTWVEVGDALAEIRDRKLYQRDYKTFEVYCQERWGWSRQRSYQLIASASAVQSLAPEMSTTVDISERAARELAPLPVPQRKQIVGALQQAGKPVTAPAVRASIPPVPTKKPEPEVVRDGTGLPIEQRLMPIWERRMEIQEMMTMVSAIRAKLKKAQEADDQLYARMNFSSAQSHLDQAFADIKSVKPFAVCPACQGRASDGCGLCKGNGMISEFLWTSPAVTESQRKFRKMTAEKKP